MVLTSGMKAMLPLKNGCDTPSHHEICIDEWLVFFSKRWILTFIILILFISHIWAATWQNQENESAPSENSDQSGHPPSLIRVFAVRKKKAWVLSYPLSAPRRLWSDWAGAQTDLSLRWAHSHFVGFDMSRVIFFQDKWRFQMFWNLSVVQVSSFKIFSQ